MSPYNLRRRSGRNHHASIIDSEEETENRADERNVPSFKKPATRSSTRVINTSFIGMPLLVIVCLPVSEAFLFLFLLLLLFCIVLLHS